VTTALDGKMRWHGKEARMSETPRTDAASRMAFSGEYMVPIQDAQNLERELAEEKAELKKYTTDSGDDSLYNVRRLRKEFSEVTKQRDALAEALLPFAQIGDIVNDADFTLWKRSVSAGSVRKAREALATTKGGDA
jgi:hypothetical protein